MEPATPTPRARISVCVNPASRPDARDGCGALEGPDVYEALRREVAKRGLGREVWITRTWCLGICPDRGCTVEVAPGGGLYREVEPSDAGVLVERAVEIVRGAAVPALDGSSGHVGDGGTTE
ncbi:MAG: (2Fe-2S) ferredoxin domain-containing protein [Deltaproteobacteria bacterium]|nr:(2Fe-2S) ferredoxin domain-containing protein [Deltaproteobacteria bacterium]